MLSKIDLSDPNANLETAFGPPVQVPSPIAGQAPTVIRYGSQARNVLLQQPAEVLVESPLGQVPASPSPSEKQSINSTSAPFAQTPQFSPPAYSGSIDNLPAYDSIPHQNEKLQFSDKK